MANHMEISPNARTVMLVVVGMAAMAFGVGMSQTDAQSCSSKLANLNVCAPFVVSGDNGATPTVNDECCGALRAVDEGCLCSTLRIANRLPSLCNLTPVSCIQ